MSILICSQGSSNRIRAGDSSTCDGRLTCGRSRVQYLGYFARVTLHVVNAARLQEGDFLQLRQVVEQGRGRGVFRDIALQQFTFKLL